MVIAPCKDCTERSITCHAECERYLAYRQEHEKEREAVQKIKTINGQFYQARQEKVFQAYKRRRSMA